MRKIIRGLTSTSAALAIAVALAGSPGTALAQWWSDDGLFENDGLYEDRYGQGTYENQEYGDDDWFYDEYDEDYPGWNGGDGYDYGYDYDNYGDYYEEDFDDEGWFDWF